MNKLQTILCMSLLSALISNLSAATAGTSPATKAINALGLELLAKASKPDSNALLSPYSIQSALAMTYAGADGTTHSEMAKALHYPGNEEELHRSFASLQQDLGEIQKSTAEIAQRSKEWGGPSEPITLTVANRLFGQKDYEFRAAFLSLLKDTYAAPLQQLDFAHDYSRARLEINNWVDDRTRHRIRDLIPPTGLNEVTRLVLVNAIYLKAPWQTEFYPGATKPLAFHINGRDPHEVPTMFRQGTFGYAHRAGFSVVTIPYSGGDLQFLIILPDAADGLPALESSLAPAMLADCANPGTAELKLYLPKFTLNSPLIQLAPALESLGMKTAFDHPEGSANFDRMAPRKPGDYLCISEVFHKTFLNLDEKGTEAAAATAVAVRAGAAFREQPQPIELRVDHPFLFAIQHRSSGTCLFLGRLTDPR